MFPKRSCKTKEKRKRDLFKFKKRKCNFRKEVLFQEWEEIIEDKDVIYQKEKKT